METSGHELPACAIRRERAGPSLATIPGHPRAPRPAHDALKPGNRWQRSNEEILADIVPTEER